MTAAEAQDRANGLREFADDPESGHIRLDALLEDIMRAVSMSTDLDECTRLGAIALYAISLVPVRWCA